MKNQDLTYTFTVDQSPEEAFAAINNVRGWWSGEIDGETDKLDAVFTYRYKDIHMSKHKITEFVPGKKVVWLVLDSYLSFVEDKTEWNGSSVVFEVSKKGNQTEVRFTTARSVRSASPRPIPCSPPSATSATNTRTTLSRTAAAPASARNSRCLLARIVARCT